MGDPRTEDGECRECGCPAWVHGPGAVCTGLGWQTAPGYADAVRAEAYHYGGAIYRALQPGDQVADTDSLATRSVAFGVSIGASCAWAGAITSVAATVVNACRGVGVLARQSGERQEDRIAELEAENAQLHTQLEAEVWISTGFNQENAALRVRLAELASSRPLSAGWHHLPDVTTPDRGFPARALRFGVP